MTETLKSFLAGWAGGAGILAVGHPFDTIKTMMQNSKPGQYKGSLDCLTQLVRKEGPTAVYKGVTAPLAGTGVVFAIYFVTYDTCERFLRSVRGYTAERQLTFGDVLICGGSTGVFGSLVLGPAELLKVRQMTASQKGLDGSFKGVCRNIWKTEGIAGFTRGLGATMIRDVPGSMAWFGAYEMVKKTICEDPKKPTVLQALVSGGCGGLGMWSFAIPLDAVKTKMQANTEGKISFIGASKEIMQVHGVKGFYRGIGPALLRAFPANAACFASKETAQKLLDRLF
jgi:solute carrier family 25 carnitine/acylcarnitine transporter 20/29